MSKLTKFTAGDTHSESIYEVLIIHFDQGTAKISEVKVGDRKKICQFSLTPGAADSNRAALEIFFSTSNFGL